MSETQTELRMLLIHAYFEGMRSGFEYMRDHRVSITETDTAKLDALLSQLKKVLNERRN